LILARFLVVETVVDQSDAMYNNFVRIQRTLRMTPATGAGGTYQLWEIGDIVAILEAVELKPAKRGACKKRK
jgi:hypothetical protein